MKLILSAFAMLFAVATFTTELTAGRANVPTPSTKATKVIGTQNVMGDASFTEVYKDLPECYNLCPECICEETAVDTPVNTLEVD